MEFHPRLFFEYFYVFLSRARVFASEENLFILREIVRDKQHEQREDDDGGRLKIEFFKIAMLNFWIRMEYFWMSFVRNFKEIQRNFF